MITLPSIGPLQRKIARWKIVPGPQYNFAAVPSRDAPTVTSLSLLSPSSPPDPYLHSLCHGAITTKVSITLRLQLKKRDENHWEKGDHSGARFDLCTVYGHTHQQQQPSLTLFQNNDEDSELGCCSQFEVMNPQFALNFQLPVYEW